MGEPSYTSAVHKWKGTMESLKAKAVNSNTNASICNGELSNCWGISAKLIVPVAPYKREMPNNIKDFFQTGQNLATNLGVNIKNDKTNTFLSYTYTDAKGIIPKNNLNSHNLGLRVNTQLNTKKYAVRMFICKKNIYSSGFSNT